MKWNCGTRDRLQYRDVCGPGDCIFVPANMLHVAVNRGVYPAVFIGSRNEAALRRVWFYVVK
jgi:hypothetical protein